MKWGIQAKQIRTNGDFNLYNLSELRDFIDDACAGDGGFAIADSAWEDAKSRLKRKYEGSGNLADASKLIEEFEAANGGTKYKSDLRQFIRESRLEDFFAGGERTVLVSTIHQTKGREFDNVFLALSRFPAMDDETRRMVYVAITRAKRNLHILYNGGCFDNVDMRGAQASADYTAYPKPEKIVLQLGHKDVALGYFAFRRKEINSLIGGDELGVRDQSCYLGDKRVLKFSSCFCRRIDELKRKGYAPAKAAVRYIVFWKDPESEVESKIILPEIEFHASAPASGAEPPA
jgi:ATP-dependent DNA helicase RecQ